MNITTKNKTEVATVWKWRCKNGIRMRPSKMETRHLFFTLRMIWNNTMPSHMHVGYKPIYYQFSEYYTDKYLKEAIRYLSLELVKRNDMKPSWKKELNKMISFFDKRDHQNLLKG